VQKVIFCYAIKKLLNRNELYLLVRFVLLHQQQLKIISTANL